MSAFDGKWKLVSHDNMIGFMQSIGYPEQLIQATSNLFGEGSDYIEEMTVSETNLKTVIWVDGQAFRTTDYELGKEFDRESKSTKKISKMLITINGNVIKTTEKGDGYTIDSTMTLDGDTTNTVMKSGKGVTATRIMTRVK